MSVAGPSQPVYPFAGLAAREEVGSTHEHELLALLDSLSPEKVDEMERSFANKTGAGEQVSDRDVAMNDSLQQARALTAFNQDRILAQQIAAGTDEPDLGPPILEAPHAAVFQPAGRRRSGLVSRIGRRLWINPRTRRNGNRQLTRNAAGPSQAHGRPFASMVGRVFGLVQPTSLANSKPTPSRTLAANLPTGHNCVACQDPIRGVEIRAPCGHYYDIGCITELFRSATKDETLYPPRCCRRNIPIAQVQLHLPRALITTLRAKETEFKTLKRVYCSSPTCNLFLGPLSEGIFARKVYTCSAPDCGRRTCGKCREQHTGCWAHVCRPDADIAQVLDLGRAAGWSRCPGCAQLIELNVGCYHMTCRCRTEFCYLCRARWKTCRCPQWDERQLFAVAEERVDAQLEVGQERLVRRHATLRRRVAAEPEEHPVRRRVALRRHAPAQRIPTPHPSRPTSPLSTNSSESSVSVSSLSSSTSSSPSVLASPSWPSPSASNPVFGSASSLSDTVDSLELTRERLVHEMVERLRVDHECNHEQWRYRDGGGICQNCGTHWRLYLFRCQGCEMLACYECWRHRL